jgi:glutamine amidotransferase
MLCVIPPGVTPDRDKLENSALNNPHGFGFAIAVPSENRIIVEKSMNPDESINRFLAQRAIYQDGYAMWHARFATHGSRTLENCHPFAVGHDDRTYLGHNGILSIEIPDKDDRSDTKVFAEELLPRLGGVTSLDDDFIWDMLQEYTSGSKVCVITVDPAAKHPMYLLNADSGKEDELGVWWSNDTCNLGYSSYTKSNVTGRYAGWYDDYADEYGWAKYNKKAYNTVSKEKVGDEVSECFNCSAWISEAELWESLGTCTWCGSCFDCESEAEMCQCGYPDGRSKHANKLEQDPIPF